MGKALVAAAGFQAATPSGQFLSVGGGGGSATEASSQFDVTEAATFSGLRAEIGAGNSGTSTLRVRNTGSDVNQTIAISGTGENEDTVNSDAFAAADLISISHTDTGSDPTYRRVVMNVEFASGHGNFHMCTAGAGVVCDVAGTRYLGLNGFLLADGTSNITQAQWKVYGYSSLESIQVMVSANARVNNSTFRLNVNGTAVGSTITYAAAATGRQKLTAMGISLSPGDLICLEMVLGAGTEDLTVEFTGCTMKSTARASEIWAQRTTGVARAASATATYYPIAANQNGSTVETARRIRPGFAARVTNLRCNLAINTYTVDATLKLFADGSPVLTATITAAGGAAWYENNVDSAIISATSELSAEIVGGTSGSITLNGVGITLEPLDVIGTASMTEAGDTAAATGTLAIKGTASLTEAGDTVAATGALAIKGVAAITEAGDTASGAAGLAIVGTASIAEEGDTLAATGEVEGAVVPPVTPRGGDGWTAAEIGALRKRLRRIKRAKQEPREPTLREMLRARPPVPVELPAPSPQPQESPPNVSIETLAPDLTPLVEGLQSLRAALDAQAFAQAVEDDDAEVLMVIA